MGVFHDRLHYVIKKVFYSFLDHGYNLGQEPPGASWTFLPEKLLFCLVLCLFLESLDLGGKAVNFGGKTSGNINLSDNFHFIQGGIYIYMFGYVWVSKII